MTRRERRIKHRRSRRIFASVMALGVLGTGVGLAVPASASNSDPCPNSFTRIQVTVGTYPDKNRNGFICRNFQENGVTYKDDNINA